MNFLTFGYGLFIILILSAVTDFSDSVVIGTAILIGCFMISEQLEKISNKINNKYLNIIDKDKAKSERSE